MFPNTIELPNARDFCREQLTKGEQCCFIGWRNELLPGLSFEEEDRFDDEAIKVAEEMKLKFKSYSYGGHKTFISDYNDCMDNSRRRLSTWFRKTVEKFGYDIS